MKSNEQKPTGNEQKVTNNEQKLTSNEQKIMNNDQKLTSNKQKLTSNEWLAKVSPQKITTKTKKTLGLSVFQFICQKYFKEIKWQVLQENQISELFTRLKKAVKQTLFNQNSSKMEKYPLKRYFYLSLALDIDLLKVFNHFVPIRT